MYKDIGGYGISYDEFKDICLNAWSEKFSYLCFDITRKKTEIKHRIFNENKDIY